MLALCFDELKNASFDTFRKAFAKTVPSVMAKINLGQALLNEATQKHVLVLMRVYLESRMRNEATQLKEIETIFPCPLDREKFTELYQSAKVKYVTRGLEMKG